MEYFTALQIFITSILFNKSEFNFKSKNFNPVKIVIIIALLINLWFTLYLLNTLNRVHNKIEQVCPQIFIKEQENNL
jgi:uncharacterized protein YacL